MKKKRLLFDCVKLAEGYREHGEYGFLQDYHAETKEWSIDFEDSDDVMVVPESAIIWLPRMGYDTDTLRQHRRTSFSERMTLAKLEQKQLGELSEDEKAEARQLVRELAQQGDIDALDFYGYACYGGNELFACDWQRAMDCFLKLMDSDAAEDEDKCRYANTLGYLFYYGRCNGGTPEYEKAFSYFSLGAAGGVHESMYKLADLYAHGRGTPKNTHAAYTLVRTVYDETKALFCRGHFDCKFADAALRMGDLCRDGVLEESAFFYYTIADFAIRKRLKYRQYGDEKVFLSIQKELARIRETHPLREISELPMAFHIGILEELFDGYTCKAELSPSPDHLKLTVRRIRPYKRRPSKVLECYPEFGICQSVSSATILMSGVTGWNIEEKNGMYANEIHLCDTNEGYVLELFFNGLRLMNCTASTVERHFPRKAPTDRTEYDFASVEFAPQGNSYDYLCELPDVSVGDRVIVLANGEEKEVRVTRRFRMAVGDMPLEPSKYKRLLRKA